MAPQISFSPLTLGLAPIAALRQQDSVQFVHAHPWVLVHKTSYPRVFVHKTSYPTHLGSSLRSLWEGVLVVEWMLNSSSIEESFSTCSLLASPPLCFLALGP